MMEIIPGPDFSTGGFIIAKELKQAYETGRAKSPYAPAIQ